MDLPGSKDSVAKQEGLKFFQTEASAGGVKIIHSGSGNEFYRPAKSFCKKGISGFILYGTPMMHIHLLLPIPPLLQEVFFDNVDIV